MSRTLVLACGLVVALAAALPGMPRAVEAAPARPNIVLFYIDDWAPYPARMWNNESRTPALARFTDQGLEFKNAIASTPLCGPARANLLTGRYGHNTGVTQNLMGPYSGSEAISARLRGAGYRTAFVGKHMNGLARAYPSRSRMAALARKWNQFDVIWHNQGRFYEWRQYRRTGTPTYGRKDSDHSSHQAALRAVKFINQTPKDKPLFLVVSLYNGHKPSKSMRRFDGSAECRTLSWAGPAYNEKDVSDKPRYVRKSYRRPQAAYGLKSRCEEAQSIDWVAGKVFRALWQNGRLKNTLQVFTADNGHLYGDHRIVGKSYPYDTWVPLYMQWPAVTGNKRRVIKEPVSNVDLGATFCALGGCQMPAPDGRSLAPLIKGTKSQLERSFIWSEMLHPGPNYGRKASARPAWMQVHSTRRYSKRLWSYTRYHTGEEELYDITTDPHRLDNLVRQSAHADALADMRGFWRSVREGDEVRWLGNLR